MLVQVVPPSVEYSQLITLPVLPLRVRLPLFPLMHTLAEPETEPPTETGSTEMIPMEEFAVAQPAPF